MDQHTVFKPVSLVLLLALCGSVAAKPPWHVVSFRRVEADPQKPYRLAESNGPWLVFAASFAGDGALKEARTLVQELRKRYKLPAYVHSERFDFTDQMDGIGINPDRSRKRMKYDNVHVRIGDGYQGWEEHAPFDKIIVTCSPESPYSLTRETSLSP